MIEKLWSAEFSELSLNSELVIRVFIVSTVKPMC